jgi:serine/threonine protein kinase
VTLRIEGYQILDELPANAWGRAFRAVQTSLERTVALTLLDPAGGEGVSSFARLLAGLTHPNLASGIDFGECTDGSYLVTEWFEGPTIAEIVLRAGLVHGRPLGHLLPGSRAASHAHRAVSL